METALWAQERVLIGVVRDLSSTNGKDLAGVVLRDGQYSRVVQIEYGRLRAAGADYIGAKFRYVVVDRDAVRSITITVDEAARRADTAATAEAVSGFLDLDEGTN